LTADQIVSAVNLTAAVWLLFLSFVSFIYWWKQRDVTPTNSDVRLMLLGVGVEALGWSLHRLFWGLVRRMRDDLGDEIYLWVSDSWIPQGILFTIILGGLIMILTPLWKMIFGRCWTWAPAALVFGTVLFFLLSETWFEFNKAVVTQSIAPPL
jgi:hypothetical protein